VSFAVLGGASRGGDESGHEGISEDRSRKCKSCHSGERENRLSHWGVSVVEYGELLTFIDRWL
jgi:hypothetical protein